MHMRPLDIPEMLIALGLVAILAWGVYNWMHRQHTQR
jgi:type II secretory pathway component PulJ